MQQTPLKSPASTSRPSQEDYVAMAKKHRVELPPFPPRVGETRVRAWRPAAVEPPSTPAMCFVLRPWQTLRATQARRTERVLPAHLQRLRTQGETQCLARRNVGHNPAEAEAGLGHAARAPWLCETSWSLGKRKLVAAVPACTGISSHAVLAFLPAFTVVGPARAASCSAICPATRLPRPPWTSELPRELGRAKEERGVLRRLMMSVRLPVCWAAWPARGAGAARKFRGREFLCEPLFSCSQRRLARPCLLTTGGHTRPLPTRLAVA